MCCWNKLLCGVKDRLKVALCVLLGLLVLLGCSIFQSTARAEEPTQPLVTTSRQELLLEMRRQMIARNSSFTILLDVERAYEVQPAVNYAIKHVYDATSDPRSGPYLEHHVRGLAYRGYEEVVIDEDTTIYKLSFTCDCWSTAEQEAAVDAFIGNWLRQNKYPDPCDTLIRMAYLFQGIGVGAQDGDRPTACEAFLEKRAAGAGRAMAVWRLCKEAGIDSHCIESWYSNGYIYWNLVKLDGQYYTFDTERNMILKGYGSEVCRVFYQNIDTEFLAEYPMAFHDYVRKIDYTFDEGTGTLTINSDILDFYVDKAEGYNPETGIYEYFVDLRPWAPIQTKIRKVVIADNVKYMGEYAFAEFAYAENQDDEAYFFNRMPLLTEVVIGSGLTRIGNRAFDEILSLEKVLGGENVTHVGYYAFWNCNKLQTADFLTNVESIREYAFTYCNALQMTGAFMQLDTVGEAAFAYCSNLTNLLLPERMTSIGKLAFVHTNVDALSIPRYIEEVGEEAFWDMTLRQPITLTLPKEWMDTKRGIGIFYGCTFDTLIVEDGWREIDLGLFEYCTFRNLFLPATVTDMTQSGIFFGHVKENFVFEGTLAEHPADSGMFAKNVSFYYEETSLDATWQYENGTLRISGTGALAGHTSCEARPWHQYADSITRVIVEEGVTGLGNYCCANMPNLVDVQLPSTLKTIGYRCFENSSSITTLKLPAGLKYIYEFAFHHLNKLVTLNIPGSVQYIGRSALNGCMALTELTLPRFRAIDRSGQGSISRFTVYSNTALGTFFHDSATSNMYHNGRPHSEFMPAGLRKVTILHADQIPEYAFCSMSMLEEVVLPAAYTSIGAYAFQNTEIRHIALPDGLLEIGEKAFVGCDFTELEIPDSVTTLGVGCLTSCFDLYSLKLPTGLTEIPDRMAAACSSLVRVEMPDTVVSIGEEAFYKCACLEQISFPAACRSLGKDAFLFCYALQGLSLPDEMQYVGSQGNDTLVRFCCTLGSPTSKMLSLAETPFYDTDCYYRYEFDSEGNELGLHVYRYEGDAAELILPENITRILKGAYAGCTGLERIELPDGLWRIDSNAFEGCSSLQRIVLPNSVEGIGEQVFLNCTGLKEVVLSDNMTSLPPETFQTCTALTRADLGKGIIELPHRTFRFCSQLEHVILPENLVTIGHNSFDGCSALASINIPETVTTIQSMAFYDCDALVTVDIPGAVESIESHAFWECSALRQINIPDSVVNIESMCFDKRSDLRIAVNCVNAYAIQKLTEDNYLEQLEIAHGEFLPESIVTEPTCTEAGYTTCICSLCGNGCNVDETEALGHIEVIDAWVDATCTMSGLTQGAHCDRCNEILIAQEVIPELGHIEVVDSYMYPTCTEPGLTEGTHCDRCNEVLIAQEVIPAPGHNEVILNPAEEPTCTTAGSTQSTICNRCGEILVPAEEIPPLQHIVVIDEKVEPTCSTFGWTEGQHCERCGDILVEQLMISALGHSEEIDVRIEPTCTDTGLTEGIHCNRCGEILAEQVIIPELGHIEVIDARVEPTCVDTGYTEGVHCERCGGSLVPQVLLPELGHDEVVVRPAVEPTCITSGWTEGIGCARCGEYLIAQVWIPELGHIEVVDVGVDPTCTDTGLTEGRHCERCGDILVVQEVIPEMGHNAVVVYPAVDPTCTSTGLTEGIICNRCGEIFSTQEVIPELGHDEIVGYPAVEPTCTTSGLTEGTVCSRCGETLSIQEVIPARGHSLALAQTRFDWTEGDCIAFGDIPFVGCEHINEMIFNAASLNETVIKVEEVGVVASETGLTTLFLTAMLSDGFTADFTLMTVVHSAEQMLLPEMLEVIEEEAFFKGSAREYVLQNAVTTIGARAFADSAIKLITIPATVTDIAPDAFEGCDVVILTTAGSYAELFANDHGFSCLTR